VPGQISKAAQGRISTRHGGDPEPTLMRLPDPAKLPDPPDHLGDAGRAAWRAVFLSAPWLGSDADLMLAAQLCDLTDERDALRQVIEREGRLAVGSQGQVVAHPAVSMLRACEKSLMHVAAVLGIGARNAASLGVAVKQLAPPVESRFEAMLARRSS
jgi:P27 family predicted phage terminase small subunit